MQQYNPAKVKRYIKQLKQREEQYVRYLGELAYQAGEQGKLEGSPLLDAYRALREIREQKIRWEEYLQRLQAAKRAPVGFFCPRCGSPLHPGASHCAYCRQPVSATYAGPAGVPQAGPHGGPVAYGAPYGTAAAPGHTIPAAGVPGAAAAPPGVPPVSAPAAPSPAAESPAGTEVETSQPAPGAGIQSHPGEPGPTRCARCGGDLEPDALFCGHCGARVEPRASGEEIGGATPPEEGSAVAALSAEEGIPHGPIEEEVLEARGGESAVPSPEGPLVCPGCGKAIEEPEARFCPDCGTRLRV